MLTLLLHKSPYDGLLWIAVALLQFMVALAVHHGRIHSKYPAFSIYIVFTAIKTFLLMALPPGDHYRIYSWFSFSFSTFQCFLIAGCIYDIYAKALGPKISLPAWAPGEIRGWLAAVLTVSVLLAITLRPQHGGPALRGLLTVQETLVIAIALALWFLVCYVRLLGIPWWPRDLQITAGFMLMLTVDAIALLVMLSLGKPYRTTLLAQRIVQLAGMVSFGWWSWALWEKEPVPVRATQEEVAALLESHRANMEAVAMAREVMG